jgi:hypothetical protein
MVQAVLTPCQCFGRADGVFAELITIGQRPLQGTGKDLGKQALGTHI